jgi:hypothetical protein
MATLLAFFARPKGNWALLKPVEILVENGGTGLLNSYTADGSRFQSSCAKLATTRKY